MLKPQPERGKIQNCYLILLSPHKQKGDMVKNIHLLWCNIFQNLRKHFSWKGSILTFLVICPWRLKQWLWPGFGLKGGAMYIPYNSCLHFFILVKCKSFQLILVYKYLAEYINSWCYINSWDKRNDQQKTRMTSLA